MKIPPKYSSTSATCAGGPVAGPRGAVVAELAGCAIAIGPAGVRVDVRHGNAEETARDAPPGVLESRQ
jgi:hypothetical protein